MQPRYQGPSIWGRDTGVSHGAKKKEGRLRLSWKRGNWGLKQEDTVKGTEQEAPSHGASWRKSEGARLSPGHSGRQEAAQLAGQKWRVNNTDGKD